jgi:hypothetical protein
VPFGEFRVGELRAVIGDNAADGEHRAGYNGVWSLTSRHESENLFVPTVAGLNLEHIFDGDTSDRQLLYEPRHADMRFTRVDDNRAELHQPATPHSGLESITTFTLEEPHYLDMRFECMAHKDVFRHSYIGLFWASYINAPLDKSIYFRSRGRWVQLCTQRHNDESTVLPGGDADMPAFSPGYPDMLYTNRSPLTFSDPFYYGRFHGMVYLLMFDRTQGVRFSHSPSGGGDNPQAQTTNPAWDFQYIIPDYEVGRRYDLRARLVYKPFHGREDLLREVQQWHAEALHAPPADLLR